MQTKVQTSAEKTQTVQQPKQLLPEPQTAFEDSRHETAQLKSMQSMMGASSQNQRMQKLQTLMTTSAVTQSQFVPGAESLQRKQTADPTFSNNSSQEATTAKTIKPNNTGLPNQLKAGIENLSGMSMDHVNVHYNSDKPAQLQAHAYAQGSDIHIAPGQEQHLPHEAWHVVQQAQGRVKPTMQMKAGVAVNDGMGLEAEADVMGAKALQMQQNDSKAQQLSLPASIINSKAPVQGVWMDGETVLDLKNFKDYPLSYLKQLLPEDSSFNLSYNAYQQQKNHDFLLLHNALKESLSSDNRIAIELIINQATQWLQNQLPDVEDEDVVNEEDHAEGSGEEEILEPEEIDATYWDNEWLTSFFCNLNVVKEQVNIGEQTGLQVARSVFNQWMSGGVKTRSQIAQLVEEEKSKVIQNKSKGTTQLARGAGESGPKSYVSTTVGKYANVSYMRDGNGYFDFTKASKKTTWSNPIKGGEVNMEAGCTKAGYGIMKDNKTKVKLQTATRAQHFSIANRICGISGSGSPAGYTWHHLIKKYKMVLVDRKVHQQHGHNGGIFLWQ